MPAKQPARLARSTLGQRECVAADRQHRVVLAPMTPAKRDADRLDQLGLTVEMRPHQLCQAGHMEGQRDDVALHRREPCSADGRVVGIDGIMAEHVPGADQRTWRSRNRQCHDPARSECEVRNPGRGRAPHALIEVKPPRAQTPAIRPEGKIGTRRRPVFSTRLVPWAAA